MFSCGKHILALFACLAWLVSWSASSSPAAAQDEPGGSYQEAIQRAVEEFDLGNWQEARALFKKAHQLNPNARTLRGMGMAAFEMRNYLNALEDLQGALRETRKPLTEEQRGQVSKLIDQIMAFLGRFRLVTEPAGATIQIDGKIVELGEDNQLVLDLGEYEITAMASGYQEQSQKITVEGGENEELRFMLEPTQEAPVAAPVPVAPPPQEPAAAEPAKKPEEPKKAEPAQKSPQFEWPEEDEGGPTWAWVALGGAALSGGVAGLFWVQGGQKFEKLKDECEEWCSQEDRDDGAEEIENSDKLTNIFLGVSGGLAALSIVLFIVESVGGESGPAEADPKAASLEFGPGSVLLQRSF